jgi:hypothetical protein
MTGLTQAPCLTVVPPISLNLFLPMLYLGVFLFWFMAHLSRYGSGVTNNRDSLKSPRDNRFQE